MEHMYTHRRVHIYTCRVNIGVLLVVNMCTAEACVTSVCLSVCYWGSGLVETSSDKSLYGYYPGVYAEKILGGFQ